MGDFKPSEEQEQIYTFAQKGFENMIVQAVAGAGKTSTLIGCAERVSGRKKCILVAHNVSTRDNLEAKLKDDKNIHVYTIHGLSFRIIMENLGSKMPEIDDNKYKNYIHNNESKVFSSFYYSLKKSRRLIYKSTVYDLIDKARYNLKQSEKEIRKLAEKKYNIRLLGDECQVVANILKWGSENMETLDYQDLLWIPYEKQYKTKKYLADIVMVDEVQDTSIAQQYIISLCFQRQTRLFAFGDADQTINSWSGSDDKAFEHLKDSTQFRRDAQEFELSTNFRCGKKIIEYAKKYTDKEKINPREGAEDGIVRHEAHFDEICDNDMVLCRNIAPLMEAYRLIVSSGKKAYFVGENLGGNLKKELDIEPGNTINEIILNIKIRIIAMWDYLSKENDISLKEAMTDDVIINLLDIIKTLENLPKTIITRDDLNKFIEEMFSNEGKEGIRLSTIHRAKGLEADNVFIICPSLIPSRLSTTDWQRVEERHLQYVMCTRALKSLNFVTEKDIAPSNAYSENNMLYKSLQDIRKEVEKYNEL